MTDENDYKPEVCPYCQHEVTETNVGYEKCPVCGHCPDCGD